MFQAFADPDRLARWWGPKGFANTFHEFEILRPERIVFDHATGPRFQMTVTLAEPQAGNTRVTWRERLTPAIEEDR